MTFLINVVKWGDFTTWVPPLGTLGEGSRFYHISIFSFLAPKLWAYLKWGRFYPLRPSPWGEGMELIFLNLFHMRDTHNDFQLLSTKTEIVVKLGQFNSPKTLTLAGLWVDFPESTSYKGHTYQFSASYLQDCDLILLTIVVKRGQFYPLAPSFQGVWRRVVYSPESTSYDGHTYQFSAS